MSSVLLVPSAAWRHRLRLLLRPDAADLPEASSPSPHADFFDPLGYITLRSRG